jgi:hypothetical protein
MRWRVALPVAVATLVVGSVVAPGFGGAASASPPRFREIGRTLGLPQDVHAWDIETGSLDGNRRLDLVMSTHAAVYAYRVRRGGVLHRMFSAAGDDPHGCAIADVDANGWGDIYCSRGAEYGTARKRNHLWLQADRGRFVERAGAWGVTDPYGRGRHVAFLDLNGDDRPDLFLGNEYPRANDIESPNRTFVNVGGERYREVRIGATGRFGAHCAQAADRDADGWDDLVVCGQRRLYLYDNRRAPDGGRRLVEVAHALGVDLAGPRSAWLGDIDGDGLTDLAVMQPWRFRLFPGRRDGGLGPAAVSIAMRAGAWIAVGDLDGRHGLDIVLVQGCADGRNQDDIVLMARGDGTFGRRVLPGSPDGCGGPATTLDIDGDGADEVIIMDGAVGGPRGPVQVFTTGDSWR